MADTHLSKFSWILLHKLYSIDNLTSLEYLCLDLISYLILSLSKKDFVTKIPAYAYKYL